VGRGNLNSYFILLIFIANVWFCFSLEYHLEYLAKLHTNRPRAWFGWQPFTFALSSVLRIRIERRTE